MVGNVPSLVNPYENTSGSSVTVKGQILYIPLQFWFNRNPRHIGIQSLKASSCAIKVKLRQYQIAGKSLGIYKTNVKFIDLDNQHQLSYLIRSCSTTK
jgi:hypothetical protein